MSWFWARLSLTSNEIQILALLLRDAIPKPQIKCSELCSRFSGHPR
jgi:hypothetical protein